MDTHRLAEEAGGLVYTAKEMPPLGVEYGTGGTKATKAQTFLLGKLGGVGQGS